MTLNRLWLLVCDRCDHKCTDRPDHEPDFREGKCAMSDGTWTCDVAADYEYLCPTCAALAAVEPSKCRKCGAANTTVALKPAGEGGWECRHKAGCTERGAEK